MSARPTTTTRNVTKGPGSMNIRGRQSAEIGITRTTNSTVVRSAPIHKTIERNVSRNQLGSVNPPKNSRNNVNHVRDASQPNRAAAGSGSSNRPPTSRTGAVAAGRNNYSRQSSTTGNRVVAAGTSNPRTHTVRLQVDLKNVNGRPQTSSSMSRNGANAAGRRNQPLTSKPGNGAVATQWASTLRSYMVPSGGFTAGISNSQTQNVGVQTERKTMTQGTQMSPFSKNVAIDKPNCSNELADACPPEGDEASQNKKQVTCPICLDGFFESSIQVTSTKCGHLFCEPCLQATLKIRKQCPVCLTSITSRSCRRLYL